MNPGAPLPVLLAARNVHKEFPGAHVLRGVNFEVKAGEVHALVGENGAGKSTLMHIFAGVHHPDSGELRVGDKALSRIRDEHQAQELGIAIVFQERSLFSGLTVAENIFPHREPVNRLGMVDRPRLRAEAAKILRRTGLAADPSEPLSHLSPAEQQMVEVAKAISLSARVVLFDEPTAALTQTETAALFKLIVQLKADGLGIIYISHRLEEIFQIADRVTVLKDGEVQGTLPVGEAAPQLLVQMMVGREVVKLSARDLDPASPVRLEVRDLSDRSLLPQMKTALSGISFSVRAGEILGIAGLGGAGRTELALSIFGARPRDSGTLRIDGQEVEINSPAEAIAAGIGYLPEDRKEAGLFLEMAIAQNMAAANLRAFGSWFANDALMESTAEDYRQKLRIACRGPRQWVQALSGGNQQKVALAKWLLAKPKVLFVDEPTRGVDVGAKSEVHALLREFSRSGAAIVVISSDLPEVLAISDRILVMRAGRIAGELSAREATELKVMQLASLN